ncbi:hypothetical protein EZJ43_13900 [Pedobacter changchengzhani]|uniref:Uncharacterized protein n=1 Tax=Pedobacter changchengzhani TaxID=2529274 RepID=A0A4R5MIP1_9SPHI|nr:DUF6364 family protein [Pedobacter changchengzhani]TDG35388.1 hypothetical protein EZJ43_13900 [Pedobacter changchengzhani]
MKARVNLTIEEDLLVEAKKHAAKIGTSVSELVESYFKKITEPKKQHVKLFEMVNRLEKPNIPEDFDFKKEYYRDRTDKYDF